MQRVMQRVMLQCWVQGSNAHNKCYSHLVHCMYGLLHSAAEGCRVCAGLPCRTQCRGACARQSLVAAVPACRTQLLRHLPQAALEELLASKPGRRVVLQLLAPDSTRYFPPHLLQMMHPPQRTAKGSSLSSAADADDDEVPPPLTSRASVLSVALPLSRAACVKCPKPSLWSFWALFKGAGKEPTAGACKCRYGSCRPAPHARTPRSRT
jgi:hypothetical protein